MENMRYHGKSIDTFEDALSMLYRNNGYSPEKYSDCISGRSFIFRLNQEDKRNWISTGISAEEAVHSVALYNNLSEETSIIYDYKDFWPVMESGCLIGPVDILERNEVQTFYYNGNRRYLYVCGKKDGMYIVHDPEGFPVQLFERDEFITAYDLKQSIAVRMKAGGCQKKTIPIYDIIRFQIRRRKVDENWNFKGNVENWFCLYEGRKKELAIQYGWNLYLQQIWKIVELLETEFICRESDYRKLENILGKMYQCALRRDDSGFLSWKEIFWTHVEKQFDSEGKREYAIGHDGY